MKFMRKENEGICKILNKGLEVASSKFISVLESEDIRYCLVSWKTSYISTRGRKNIETCCGGIRPIDEAGNQGNSYSPKKRITSLLCPCFFKGAVYCKQPA